MDRLRAFAQARDEYPWDQLGIDLSPEARAIHRNIRRDLRRIAAALVEINDTLERFTTSLPQ